MNKPILAAYCAHGGITLVSDETLKDLDIIYYAFGVVEGHEIVFNYPEDLKKISEIRKKHPHLKIILSIGGGGCGKVMSAAVATDESFNALVDGMFHALLTYHFDGIDLDWEFPNVKSPRNERHLHSEVFRILRQKMDATGKKYYLTSAVPDSEWTFSITELDKSHIYLDYINIMTYDMSNKEYTSHHCAPYPAKGNSSDTGRSVYAAIKAFEKHSIPKEKIIIGAAFYSKKWDGVTGGENGLKAPVESDVQYGPSISSLEDNYVDKNGFVRYWDDEAKAPFLYDGNVFLTYDDTISIGYKCEMVVNEDIAGMMVWELAGDKRQILLPYMRKRMDELHAAKN